MDPLEFCREWPSGAAAPCGKPATVIIWGKLMNREALGPRCDDHAADHIGGDYYSDRLNQWAVFDLRGLVRTSR